MLFPPIAVSKPLFTMFLVKTNLYFVACIQRQMLYVFSLDSMSNEIKTLREALEHSSRQKDSLIVQLQQTLVLLTQQHYQKMMKPTTTDTTPTVTASVTEAEAVTTVEAELVTNGELLTQ